MILIFPISRSNYLKPCICRKIYEPSIKLVKSLIKSSVKVTTLKKSVDEEISDILSHFKYNCNHYFQLETYIPFRFTQVYKLVIAFHKVTVRLSAKPASVIIRSLTGYHSW